MQVEARRVFVDAFFGKDGPARDDEHPPADVQLGQELVSNVVHALESPQWPGVAMFFTYDEHGGYYDHVAPPSACACRSSWPPFMTHAIRDTR